MLALGLALLLGSGVMDAPGRADVETAANLRAMLVTLRESAGLEPLETSATLQRLADRRASEIAAASAARRLPHPVPLDDALDDWPELRERLISERVVVVPAAIDAADRAAAAWDNPEAGALALHADSIAVGLGAWLAADGSLVLVAVFRIADNLTDRETLERSVFDEINEVRVAHGMRTIIEPVAMLYRQPEDKRIFDDQELADLQTHFAANVRKALTEDDGYQVVEVPGPGTATLRIGITDVDATIGALNVTIYTKITGAGLGGAAMEGEVVDSVTGEQIGAVIRWGSGSRILRAGFTHTGDAKIVINRWAKDLRERIDEAHGR